MFPLLFLLCGRLFQYMIERKSYLLTGALGLWMVGSIVWILPHYLSYFNEFVGGPAKGYYYLIDSNIDWGQDLIRLHEYLNHQGLKECIYLILGQ